MSDSDSDSDPFGIGLDDELALDVEEEAETTRQPFCSPRLLELLVLESAEEEIAAALKRVQAGAAEGESDEWASAQVAVATMAQQLVHGQYPDLLRDSEVSQRLLGPSLDGRADGCADAFVQGGRVASEVGLGGHGATDNGLQTRRRRGQVFRLLESDGCEDGV